MIFRTLVRACRKLMLIEGSAASNATFTKLLVQHPELIPKRQILLEESQHFTHWPVLVVGWLVEDP